MALVPNKPSPEGRKIGEHLARMTDKAEAELRQKLQVADAMELMPERCRSCAFRGGTFPNGCTETVMDAIKCAMEGVPFYCHQSKPKEGGGYTELCGGYTIARTSMIDREPMETPWPFSHEEQEDATTGGRVR